MDIFPNRRDFLQLSGTAATLSLAGCNALQDDGQSTPSSTSGNKNKDTTGSESASQQSTTVTTQATQGENPTVTLIVEIDQEALQQKQQQLQSAVRNGSVNRTQAQQQYRAFQTDLITSAVQSFRQRVQDINAITIEDTVDQFGAILISGTPAALIKTVSYEEVRSLSAQTTFAQTKAQAESS